MFSNNKVRQMLGGLMVLVMVVTSLSMHLFIQPVYAEEGATPIEAELEGGESGELEPASHIHGQWAYEVFGNTIMAYCCEENDYEHCELPDGCVTLKINAVNQTYTGKPVTVKSDGTQACVTFEGAAEWTAAGLEIPTVRFFMDEECTTMTNTSAATGKAASEGAAPVVIGKYYAAIPVMGYEEVIYAVTSFEIVKGTPYIATIPTATAVEYGTELAGSSLTRGVAQVSETDNTVVAGTFSWVTGTTVPTIGNSGYEVVFTPEDTDNWNTVTKTVNIVVNKHDITATVSIANWEVGSTPNTPVVTGNTGNGSVTYQYKRKLADDSTYSTTVPTEVGEYTVRAVIAETDTYNGTSVTANFAITEHVKTDKEVFEEYKNSLLAKLDNMKRDDDSSEVEDIIETGKQYIIKSTYYPSLTLGENLQMVQLLYEGIVNDAKEQRVKDNTTIDININWDSFSESGSGFTMGGYLENVQIPLDLNGDGIDDFTGGSLDGEEDDFSEYVKDIGKIDLVFSIESRKPSVNESEKITLAANKTFGKDIQLNCIDVSLTAQVGDSQKIEVHKFAEPITFFAKPNEKTAESLDSGACRVGAIRLHDGEAKDIPCGYDKSKGIVVFETDSLSLFAIVLISVPVEPETHDHVYGEWVYDIQLGWDGAKNRHKECTICGLSGCYESYEKPVIQNTSHSATTDKSQTTDYYIVVKGDTLCAIARRYNMKLAVLLDLNKGIKNKDLIYPGDKIKVN